MLTCIKFIFISLVNTYLAKSFFALFVILALLFFAVTCHAHLGIWNVTFLFWGKEKFKINFLTSETLFFISVIPGKGTDQNRKGVRTMELSPSDTERNMRQFCKKAIRTLDLAARAGHAERRRRADRETIFSDLTAQELNQLFVMDKYFSDEVIFKVLGFKVVVQDPILAEALKQLPEHRRNIILLKYFLSWTDKRIGETFQIKGDTIRHQRLATLKLLERLLKED